MKLVWASLSLFHLNPKRPDIGGSTKGQELACVKGSEVLETPCVHFHLPEESNTAIALYSGLSFLWLFKQNIKRCTIFPSSLSSSLKATCPGCTLEQVSCVSLIGQRQTVEELQEGETPGSGAEAAGRGQLLNLETRKPVWSLDRSLAPLSPAIAPTGQTQQIHQLSFLASSKCRSGEWSAWYLVQRFCLAPGPKCTSQPNMPDFKWTKWPRCLSLALKSCLWEELHVMTESSVLHPNPTRDPSPCEPHLYKLGCWRHLPHSRAPTSTVLIPRKCSARC